MPRASQGCLSDADVDGVLHQLTSSRAGAAALMSAMREIATTGDMDADLRSAVRHHIAQAVTSGGAARRLS